MRTSRFVQILSAVVATITMGASSSLALGSHQPKPGPTPQPAITYLTPAYCLFNSSGASDSTEQFTNITIGSGRHTTSLLALSLTTAKNGDSQPYGVVTNASRPTFASLAFDASGNIGNNSGAGILVLVANTDGFLNIGADFINDIKASPTLQTPSGFTHFIATPANLDFQFPDNIDQLATFVSSEIGLETFSVNATKNMLLTNVQLNGGTVATGALATPSNNCLI
jgi:hypothetical protein